MKLPDSEAAHVPTTLYGTVNGALGVIASLSPAQYGYLSRLQVRRSSAGASPPPTPPCCAGELQLGGVVWSTSSSVCACQPGV